MAVARASQAGAGVDEAEWLQFDLRPWRQTVE
jgi:hypothetical protein